MYTPTHPTRRPPLLFAALCLLWASGCAPPFSELQSASLAGPDRVEITPHYSRVSYREDGEGEKVQDEFGLQVASGIGERTDLRARFHLIRVDEESVGVVGLGPKFGLSPDRFAIYVPVGFAFGSGIDIGETFQVHPTAILSIPAGDQAEVNLSAKALVPFDRDIDDLVAFNAGLAFGPDLSRWAIRPEAGVLINPGEDGAFWHFSVGFTTWTRR